MLNLPTKCFNLNRHQRRLLFLSMNIKKGKMYDNDEIIEHKLSHLRPHCQMYDLQKKIKYSEEASNLNGETHRAANVDYKKIKSKSTSETPASL